MAMLRCSPSRIRLTLADLEGFEERFQARRASRLARPRISNVRLSPGPAHPTRLSFVLADQNVGRSQSASSSTSIAVWEDEEDKQQDVGLIAVDGVTNTHLPTSTDGHWHPDHQSTPRHEAVTASGIVGGQHRSPLRPSPRRQVESFYEDRRELQELEREIAEHSPASNLDGVDESEVASLAPITPFFVRQDHGSRLPPQTEPRPFSSARARRRHARSSEDPALHHEGIRPFSTQSQILLDPVPQLVLLSGPSQATLNPVFDPSAPAFIPRTRFGAAVGSSIDGGSSTVHERPYRSLDYTASTSSLRVRSSGELNIEPAISHRTGPAHQPPSNEQLPPRQRQRSRTSDQNTAFPLPSPNLERYPLLRPPSSLAAPRRTSTFERSLTGAFDRPPTSAEFLTANVPASESHHPQHYHVRRAVTPCDHGQLLDASFGIDLSLRSISPALSTSSRSTPNLLNPPLHPTEIHSRGSSLSWRRSRHPTPVGSVSHFSSMPTTAIASPYPVASQQSSREGLDAAAEFLRMRNSPLDDLTERLSRLAAGRQRSVGRSWERHVPERRGRVSLLTGDPFRQQESEQDPATSVPSPSITDAARPFILHANRASCYRDNMEHDPVTLAMALPPSSPLASSSQALPSTPPARLETTISSLRSPLAQRSPKKLPTSPPPSIKRKPVPSSSSTHATPQVKVYDDTEPATAQPQTPADVYRSSRRTKTRSETSVQQSPLAGGAKMMLSSPQAPPSPERNPYRNTYPPAPALDAPASAGAIARPSAGRPWARARVQRSSENEVENDVEALIAPNLEQDRRTWLARREQGDLEVTPPREGRFERYLS